MAQTASTMPLSGDRHAPTFDPLQPRSLACYFQNLEALFVRAQVADDEAKKQYGLLYVSIEVAD